MCRPFVHCRLLLLNSYSHGLYFRVFVKRPVYFLIWQSAVNVSTHHQPIILQDFLPCILFAIGKNFKHTLENILRSYSVNPFLLHISKTLLLIICAPLAHHSIAYGG